MVFKSRGAGIVFRIWRLTIIYSIHFIGGSDYLITILPEWTNLFAVLKLPVAIQNSSKKTRGNYSDKEYQNSTVFN
jgi:hypothetical protein